MKNLTISLIAILGICFVSADFPEKENWNIECSDWVLMDIECSDGNNAVRWWQRDCHSCTYVNGQHYITDQWVEDNYEQTSIPCDCEDEEVWVQTTQQSSQCYILCKRTCCGIDETPRSEWDCTGLEVVSPIQSRCD